MHKGSALEIPQTVSKFFFVSGLPAGGRPFGPGSHPGVISELPEAGGNPPLLPAIIIQPRHRRLRANGHSETGFGGR